MSREIGGARVCVWGGELHNKESCSSSPGDASPSSQIKVEVEKHTAGWEMALLASCVSQDRKLGAAQSDCVSPGNYLLLP